MTHTSQVPPRYKVFLTAGVNDFLRTPAGAVRFFDDIPTAQAASSAAGGGFVLPADAPAPAGFDRPTF